MTAPDNRATVDALADLHRVLAEKLKAKIESGEATAADFNAAIQFLRSNDIKAMPATDTPLEQLGRAVQATGIVLPFEGKAA